METQENKKIEPKELTVSSSPHIRDKISTNKIYLFVIAALLPATLGSIYFFKLQAFLVIAVSLITAILVDYGCQKITGHKLGFNLSAIITGLLFALIIPSTVPLWLPVVGVAVAISIGKYSFGPGNAIFNPAAFGRIFVALSFPAMMAGYVTVDGITSATPLQIIKHEGYQGLLQHFGTVSNLYHDLFIGNIPGALGETSALLLLLGGIFLIIMKVIDWQTPTVYIGTVSLIAILAKGDILFHLLSGGLILGAFFMATDYVTTPATKKGKIIFAIGCGVITMILRLYSGYPEGVAFSILLMNTATPMIDRYTFHKPFGYGNKIKIPFKK